MGQTHAIARPPTAVTKSYGASGDIWDILRFGSPTALLSKGLITPEQYASLMEQQASAEDPLPRYAEERQELIEGPLPVKPLEEPSVEFLSEIFADPTNLLLGGVGMAGMASKKVLTKGIKSLSNEGGALNRVFQGNEPIFANRGMDETASLLTKLDAEGAEGDIFIARDKLKAMIKEHDPTKSQIIINKSENILGLINGSMNIKICMWKVKNRIPQFH